MRTTLETLQESRDASISWRFVPNSGRWWFDLLALCLLNAIESHILPHILGGGVSIDLMTPWLVVGFVTLPFSQSLIQLVIVGILQETGSAAPFGLYVCSYWVIGAMIYLVRGTLSWRHHVPWLVTFFISLFWVANFETFVVFVRRDPNQLDFFYFLHQLMRIIVGCAFGMILAQPWIQKFRGEHLAL